MLLKHILNEVLIEMETGDDVSSAVEKEVTERTLKDTFTVMNTGLEYVKAELEKLNKKAKRIGTEPLQLKIIREFDKDVPARGMQKTYKRHYFEIKVEGKSPVIDGYEFVASVEHAEGGNIINMAPNSSVPALPAEYRTTGNTCDFCHTKRDRLSTFVLREEKTGKLLKVGRSCLKNFLPSKNPKTILDYAQSLENALRACIGGEEMDDYDEDFVGGGGRGFRRYYPSDVFMRSVCLAYVLEGKFISAKKAKDSAMYDDRPLQSTKDVAWWLIYEGPNSKDPEIAREYQQKVAAHGGEAEKLFDAVSKWLETKDWDAEIDKNQETNPSLAQYFHNVKTIANSTTIATKNSALHASILAIYLREKGELEKKAQRKPSNYVGKVGDKIEFVGTVKNVKLFDGGAYGPTTLVSFEDADGNEIVWWASGDKPYEKGEVYTVKGTVKKQEISRYTGQPQTTITRAKMVPAGGGKLDEQEKFDNLSFGDLPDEAPYSIFIWPNLSMDIVDMYDHQTHMLNSHDNPKLLGYKTKDDLRGKDVKMEFFSRGGLIFVLSDDEDVAYIRGTGNVKTRKLATDVCKLYRLTPEWDTD